jgi:Tol biopolymer transport system component
MNPDTNRLDPGFDPRVADWLEADPDHAPRDVLDTILAALPSVQQRPVIRGPWRLPIMLTPPRLAVAAVLGVLLIGGAVLAYQRPDRTNVASPSPAPSVLPSATPVLPSSAPSVAVASPLPAPTPKPKLIAFETSAFTTPHSDTVRVEREDGSDLHELLPDIRSSHLIGRVPDGDQVLVTFDGDERLMALVDLADGQIHAIPRDCPSADCWADFANVFGSGRGGVSMSADGRQAAMVLSDREGRTAVIGIVDLATGSTSVIESTRVPIGDVGYGLSDPRLSPDGRTVAYLLPDARLDPRKCWVDAVALMVVDRFDGSSPRRLVGSDRCPSDPAWSPSGTDLAVTSNDVTFTPGSSPGEVFAHEHHDVYVVSVKGAKVRRLTTNRTSSHAAWTADGRISYAVIRDNAEHDGSVVDVWIVDPDTGHRTRLKRTLRALGDAGCRSCAFLWVIDSGADFPVIGLWQ